MKKYNIWTNFFGDVGNCNFFMNCIETYQFSLVLSEMRDHIGGVMVSALASSAVDRGFEPR
jgi:hypothetical protein